MKNHLVMILVTFLLTAGCTQKSTEVKKMIETDGQSSEVFELKALCAEYENKALAQLKEDYNYNDPMFTNMTASTKLEKIFYSKKANSCLYTLTNSILIKKQRCKHFTLKDVLSKEELIDEYSCEEPEGIVTSANGKSYSEAYKDFSTQIIEYDPDFQGIDNWNL